MSHTLDALLDRATGGRTSYERLVRAAGLPADLAEALLAPLPASDKAALRPLEALRARLEQDKREVVMMDFGAGAGTEHRSAEQMAQGVPTTRVVGPFCKTASKPPMWCEFLFRLVRHRRPVSCIEMGTCLGMSASYIATALRLNGLGRLVTLDGAEALAAIAADNLAGLGLDNAQVRVGSFAQTLEPTLHERRPVDFMFIDGHHDRDATLHYLEQARPHLAERNLLVFDDIDWSEGMREAWAKIRAKTQAYGFGNVGLCVDVAPVAA